MFGTLGTFGLWTVNNRRSKMSFSSPEPLLPGSVSCSWQVLGQRTADLKEGQIQKCQGWGEQFPGTQAGMSLAVAGCM